MKSGLIKAILPNGMKVLLPDDLPGAHAALLWEFREEFPLMAFPKNLHDLESFTEKIRQGKFLEIILHQPQNRRIKRAE